MSEVWIDKERKNKADVRIVMAAFQEAGRVARERSQHVAWKGKLVQYESWSQRTNSLEVSK
jgi:hypothetical protein